tara:strand:- start:513 stop:944 length:432 start_codon:yes stop_codon:yes gene_type:complete
MTEYGQKARTFENMKNREREQEMSEQEKSRFCDNCDTNTTLMRECNPMHREDTPSCSDCFRSYERDEWGLAEHVEVLRNDLDHFQQRIVELEERLANQKAQLEADADRELRRRISAAFEYLQEGMDEAVTAEVMGSAGELDKP